MGIIEEINGEELVRLYRKHGYEPARRIDVLLTETEKKCCGLAILLKKKGVDIEKKYLPPSFVEHILEISEDERVGFMTGWDDSPLPYPSSPVMAQTYTKGKECWEYVAREYYK